MSKNKTLQTQPHPPSNSSHRHCHYRLTEKWNMKSVRFWTPSWTDAVDWTIGYTTWYAGWVTKEPMRRPHGFQPKTSPIHWNSASYSTSDILTSWAPATSEKESLITCHITAR